jgi:hypothetical protein
MLSQIKPIITSSYYANLKNINKGSLISISRSCPIKSAKIKSYSPLFPEWEIINNLKKGLITKEEYTKSYIENTLNKLDLDTVIKDLIILSGNEQIIYLLCYEKPTDFCHRHLVIDWLEQSDKIEIIKE